MNRSSQGMALIVVIATMATLSLLSTVMFSSIGRELNLGRVQRGADTAEMLAEAGVQKTVAEFASGNIAYSGEAHTPLGGGEYSVRVTKGSDAGFFLVESVGAIVDAKRVIYEQTISAMVEIDGAGIRWRRMQRVEAGS